MAKWGMIGGLCLLLYWQCAIAQEPPYTRKPIMMPELTVLGSKTKYEENNPAVALIEKVSRLEHARRQRQVAYSYQQVDQLSLSLASIDKWQSFLMKVAPFFDHYLTSSKIDGSAVLPLSWREKVTLKGYNAEKEKTNEAVIYHNMMGIDQNFSDGTNTIRLEELLPELDLFQSKVRMLQTEFPTPLGVDARSSYRFYLTDTIVSQGKIAQVVEFIPRNPYAPSFTGRFEIAVGVAPHLLQASLVFPKMTNVNFVESLRVQQWFGGDEDHWHLTKEHLAADMKLFFRKLSAYVEHNRSYDKYEYEQPDSTLVYATQQYQDRSSDQDVQHIISRLKSNKIISADEGLRHFMDEFRKHPWQRLALEAIDMIGLNYLRTKWDYNKVYGGSHFDIGPISEIVNVNSVEGLRIRLGGRTTGYFSRKNFFEGYGAYGFKDQRWKYSITYAHSFRTKRYFREEYPRNEISINHRYDLYIPGQIIENTDRTNILYDVGIPHFASRSYRSTWSLQYQNDFSSEFSINLFANYFRDLPHGNLEYVRVNADGSIQKLSEIRDTVLGLELRWAPGERIFEGSMQRHGHESRVQREVPVYRLKHEWASMGLGGDYNRQRTELSMEQRLWMGIFGRLDYQLSVGKIWSAVPYPILYTPPTNIGILYGQNTFSLLNPLEFVADEWATAFVQYHMRGLIFDRIPLVKNLKLRGVLTINAIYGNLTKKNRQESGEELFLLPMHSREMNNEFYAEIGFGLENILRALRIDVYRRITPLTPFSRSPWGVTLGFNVNF
ncbi:MAG: DUF5686 family protein [Bacteroidales bacterium]|uniref:DUF5686 family protein n=1 Tax=Porphyromonas sp. TaxID=1924944 RepID=UPI00297577D1|nr:DUF5686 family protein [Porphyromonas sp.]MDD7438926.1 DUF5686 family protein [Bacteroidales bacterium]MDY3066510.1 DUF5686 family protein [Porphyromonas sp.]